MQIVLFVPVFAPFVFAHKLGKQWSGNPFPQWVDRLPWQIMEPVQILVHGSRHWNDGVLHVQNLVAAHHLRFFQLPHFRRDFLQGKKLLRPARFSFYTWQNLKKSMNNSFPLARQHPHRRFGTLRCWKSLLALYVWPGVCWKGICLSICSGCPGCAKGFPLFTTVKRTQNGSK